jgi:hypothetical protein
MLDKSMDALLEFEVAKIQARKLGIDLFAHTQQVTNDRKGA